MSSMVEVETSLARVPAIEVERLVIRYGDAVAVDDVSFSAERSSVLALLGPNGAGKTSTVEALEGYRRPASGAVRVLGLDPVADRARVVPRIGVMLQSGGVYVGMDARRALRLFAAYYDDPRSPEELIDLVGLGRVADTPWRRLSGGEKQRLSLALALVGRPEVAFLDEPTAGVDPAGRLAIRQVIADLRSEGVCVVLTTHELEEAERLADRVVMVAGGKVVATGTPAELMESGGGRRIRFSAPAGLDAAALGAAMEAPVDEERPGEYVVETAASPAAVARLTAWLAERELPLADLRAGRHSLEDVFLELTASTSVAAVERTAGRRRGRDGRAEGRRARRSPGRSPA
ncbi:MAG TPA: ABC transporter ATP-binding protein [Acidimicrobiales bacterium]|nr:ABC transporter ATP-binding protein [Acidimicrobiales bacterium]